MSYSEPSATNVYLPTTGDAEASAYMISGFSRNVNKFSLPRYSEIRPVTQMNGNFLRWRSEQAMRVRYSDGRDLNWPIGQPRPSGQDNMELFEFQPFACQRKQKSFPLPREVRQQAAWPIQAWQATVPAGQIMTERVMAANNCLVNATWNTNQANVDGSYGALDGNAAL
ncbi:MAG TPA: hypothetical protein PLB88_04655, partial [Thermoanaerobaculaceae bacterium]|nr:hypothetical protein [Thermoanaerobaculaceae bacterium]